jgi:ribonuclease P protein component
VHAARLRRNADIAAVRQTGVTVQHRLFAVRAAPNDLGVTRLAVSAPRSLGTAVARNRARRRLREAFSTVMAGRERASGRDLIVTARREVATATPALLREAVATTLASLQGTRSAVG